VPSLFGRNHDHNFIQQGENACQVFFDNSLNAAVFKELRNLASAPSSGEQAQNTQVKLDDIRFCQ
jgi:hypothetical protein